VFLEFKVDVVQDRPIAKSVVQVADGNQR